MSALLICDVPFLLSRLVMRAVVSLLLLTLASCPLPRKLTFARVLRSSVYIKLSQNIYDSGDADELIRLWTDSYPDMLLPRSLYMFF